MEAIKLLELLGFKTYVDKYDDTITVYGCSINNGVVSNNNEVYIPISATPRQVIEHLLNNAYTDGLWEGRRLVAKAINEYIINDILDIKGKPFSDYLRNSKHPYNPDNY